MPRLKLIDSPPAGGHRRAAMLALLLAALLVRCPLALAEERSEPLAAPSETALFGEGVFSGYLKSFNLLTRGSEPSLSPNGRGSKVETVSASLARLRLRAKPAVDLGGDVRLLAKIEYDLQGTAGSYVGSGADELARRQSEAREFLDLSGTLASGDDARLSHRLYRASVALKSESFTAEVGRQQIPWGVGYFFSPTDLFNPFLPTQLELDERPGVDAVYLSAGNLSTGTAGLAYTPKGGELHPRRVVGRLARDAGLAEVGLLGGLVASDSVAGADVRSPVGESTVRGEVLFRDPAGSGSFLKFLASADTNLPGNVYVLLEYFHNGEGKSRIDDYDWDRLLAGEVSQLARDYAAVMIGYDLTPLLRVESRAVVNLNDVSVLLRPELRYSLRNELTISAAAQLFVGRRNSEFGAAEDLYAVELKGTF
jgi:hypothetical protein